MSVRYTSTRGKHNDLSFEEVVLGGLANDKGLFVPIDVPTLTLGEIEDMRSLSFCDLAFEVMSRFIEGSSVPANDLKAIIAKSFSSFRSTDVTPIVKCQEFFVLELFHGPTFAFKDVALQFLGNLFEFFLTRGNLQKKLTILGATSGDTGSAAIHGLRGKANVDCFIMFPTGKVTEIQERQMTTIADSNIHCMSIDGDFDDCQALVKAAFADEAFRKEVSLGAVNSINWARVLAQITYYFYSWLRVTDSHSNDTASSTPDVLFAVPTGNFGDILAGYYAKRMGLPIGKLMICTNQNDVLHRFFQTGEYRKTPAVPTMAPSMDISVSSNFERYLYYLADECGEELAQWMEGFESSGVLTVSRAQLQRARHDFCSFAASREVIISTMTDLFDKEGYLVCPHTATAVAGLQDLLRQRRQSAQSAGEEDTGGDNGEYRDTVDSDTILVCLATAHPAKFEAAVQLALRDSTRPHPPRPPELDMLFGLVTRKVHLGNSLSEVQTFVRQNVHA